MKIITQILELISNFLHFKIKKEEQRINEEEKERKQKKTIDQQKQEAQDAVFNGDADAVNKIISSSVILILGLILCGCATEKVVYVPGDRQVKRITYEDVTGYFVPDTTMSELLGYKVEAKYYKEKYEAIKYKEDNQ